MLDITFIREHPDKVKENIRMRGLVGPQFLVDEFLRTDEKKRSVTRELEGLRALRNKLSDVSGKPSPKVIEEVKRTKAQIKLLEADLQTLDQKWQWYMEWFPNMLDASVPVGKDASDNVEVRAWAPGRGYFSALELGTKDFAKQWMPHLAFESKDHLALGELLDIVDTKQSAVVSGSRFTYLKGAATLLQYALFDHLKAKLLQEGFTPMVVPLMVRREALFGSSHFPGDEDQVYRVDKKGVEEQTDLYLVGSSEPALFAYYMGKTVRETELPCKFFASTPCFRTEVGSWGKDVKGIKRVHQFDKLEMDLLCRPSESATMHEYLLGINEWFYQSLELPYHVILMCSGDAGYFATAKKYDIEVWLPHSGEFIELGSDTNAKDYQARRYNIKYKAHTGEVEYVHTVNDTGCPAGRTILAILENYQQPDGSVVVPKVLRPYLNGLELISPK
jgi:seryl-tRNA synthetase